MKFGDNLKTIRKNKNMSQEQLAEKINVSRQSVSKWETGDAYPEMNHILELCKIFHCKINDLIHTDMSDISSFDEKIVMDVVKLNEQKQTQEKALSNIISLIGKIGAIVLKVAIPFVIIAMLLIPYIVHNVEIEDNKIIFKTDNIKFIEDDTLEVFDFMIIDINENDSEINIVDVFQNHSKTEIIIYLEAGFIFLIVDLILMIYILNYVEKLFNNIKNNTTPFTLENVFYIKRISYFMIALILITPLSGVLFESILGVPSSGEDFELMNILEILIIFSMSYIFEYGYEIQKDSSGRMYN